MIDLLLHKSSFQYLHTQALAPDSCGIHAATVFLVGTKTLNAQVHLGNSTIGVCFTVLDSVGHGSYHQAVAAGTRKLGISHPL